MKTGLRIDFAKKEIIMSRSFEKRASVVGTEEYKSLQMVRNDYPSFSLVRKHIKKAPNKETYAGLTYAYMEDYIQSHDEDGSVHKRYCEMRLIGACHKVSYPTIKKWFLETYPEIAKFGMDDAA